MKEGSRKKPRAGGVRGSASRQGKRGVADGEKGGGNREKRKGKSREERENRAKTKTEMGLVTAAAGAAVLTLTRGPSTATHRRSGHSTGKKGGAENLGWGEVGPGPG